jgi:hypothetical protein
MVLKYTNTKRLAASFPGNEIKYTIMGSTFTAFKKLSSLKYIILCLPLISCKSNQQKVVTKEPQVQLATTPQNDTYDSLALAIKKMMEVHYRFEEGQIKIDDQQTASNSWIEVKSDSFSVDVLTDYDKMYVTVFHLTEFNTLYPSSHKKIYEQQPVRCPVSKEKIFGVLLECFQGDKKSTFFRLMKNAR